MDGRRIRSCKRLCRLVREMIILMILDRSMNLVKAVFVVLPNIILRYVKGGFPSLAEGKDIFTAIRLGFRGGFKNKKGCMIS